MSLRIRGISLTYRLVSGPSGQVPPDVWDTAWQPTCIAIGASYVKRRPARLLIATVVRSMVLGASMAGLPVCV